MAGRARGREGHTIEHVVGCFVDLKWMDVNVMRMIPAWINACWIFWILESPVNHITYGNVLVHSVSIPLFAIYGELIKKTRVPIKHEWWNAFIRRRHKFGQYWSAHAGRESVRQCAIFRNLGGIDRLKVRVLRYWERTVVETHVAWVAYSIDRGENDPWGRPNIAKNRSNDLKLSNARKHDKNVGTICRGKIDTCRHLNSWHGDAISGTQVHRQATSIIFGFDGNPDSSPWTSIEKAKPDDFKRTDFHLRLVDTVDNKD
mmetsp:Transcript_6864/g.14986  ORF Transcript_6864/g.14986 Transcript_6864/m.14986 type:complete len:259 (-) Transcript_6864:1793-2569(-)